MVTRLKARWVVGFDGQDHVLYENAEVVYAESILYVGPRYDGPVDEEHDAGEALVCPGFIDLNALADIDHAILDHWQGADRQDGLTWSEDYFRHRRHEVFDREHLLLGRRYALVQLLLNGITTAMPIAAETYRAWAETYDEFVDVAGIAEDLGLRTYLGPSYRAGIPVVSADGSRRVAWDEEMGDRGLAQAVAFARDCEAQGGLARGALVPARVETLGPALVRGTRTAQEELDVPVRFHAAQSLSELRLVEEQFGRHPIRLLSDEGLLGPRTMIAHAWAINGHSQVGRTGDDDHRGLLADSGTTVVYCPMANARYAMVLESFDRYRREGINVALGTDTFPPDMIRVMEAGSSQAKAADRDRDAGQAADLLRAGTLAGARALRRDDLGRLAPGAKADLVVVGLDDLRTGVMDDPVRGMINHATGACVRTVVVNGRAVVRDGAIPGLDVAALREAAQACFDRYRTSFSERDHRRREPGELFPPSFRRGPHTLSDNRCH
ncbi:chlorohydrolase family protein [Planotetraspora sp. GP83]|uniref:chlorohydrolase family protein n=1 Tax=Planotetraspora sp. GP83 TaxID=3156264 RepID=UPI003512C6BF